MRRPAHYQEIVGEDLMAHEVEDLLRLLSEDIHILERVQRETKVVSFIPNRPQRLMSSSDATFRCLFGANKVGKSTWGILEDIAYARGFRQWLPEDHPRYRTPFAPPVRGMIFGETWEKVDEIHTPKFEEWIPKEAGAKPIRVQGKVRGWHFSNGSEIRYATYEMHSKRLEGADKHFYHFDEPPPYSHWAPVVRGIVVHGGKLWLTLTLLSEGWIWDEIWEKAEAGDRDYFAVVGDIRDNVFDPSTGSGALKEENIQKFEGTLDETQKEVRLHGKPQHLQGRIFKQFRVGPPWVIPAWDIPPDWPAIRAFDPHIKKPIAGLWGRVSPSGQIIITDELFDDSITGMDTYRDRVAEIERARGHRVAMSVMDQAGKAPSGLWTVNYFELFRKYGLWVTEAHKADRAARLMETAERFKLDNYTKLPAIQVFENCKHLIWEIKRYVHPELRNSSRTDRYKDVPEGPHKKDDDLVDCLQYLVSMDPKYENLEIGFNQVFAPSMGNDFESDYGTPWVGGAEEYTDAISDRY